MNVYGDRGNLEIMVKRLSHRNIQVTVDELHIGETVDFLDYDLLYIGGGNNKSQQHVHHDLLSRKHALQAAYDAKVFFLMVCGGYQLFGKYYIDYEGACVDGVSLFEYYTVNDGAKSCTGNIIIESTCLGSNTVLVGYENHSGQTLNVKTPLGYCRYGNGNQYGGKYEGYREQTVIGTYMHGPLLSKNPELADEILLHALKRRNTVDTLDMLDDTLEHLAKSRVCEQILYK